jgi:hypothetical protein
MLNGQKRVIEVEKEEAEEILAVNTFKEIKGMKEAFGKLATAINQKKDDGVADAIKESTKATTGLIQAVKDIPKPETPEVNVEITNDKILPLIEKMCKEVCDSNEKVIQALNNRPIVDSFEVTAREYNGIGAKTIKVNYKPLNQVTSKTK